MDINLLRLVNQQLSGTIFQTPKEIVSWMGAIQSQDYNMAKMAIGVRLPGSSAATVEEALNSGEILRTHILRPTWHFVVPENIRWMLMLTSERIKASSKSRDMELGITDKLYEAANKVIQRALEEQGQMTRKELSVEVERAGMAADTPHMTHFMMRTEADCLVCSGAMKGKEHTYALFEERVPKVVLLHRSEALAKLAGIYFRSHGPATLHDFVWWSGLSVTEARDGLESIKGNLINEEANGQTYWFFDTLDFKRSEKNRVHLLPAFDEYIVSYKERNTIITKEYSKVISSNGVFRPVVLLNGKVVGIWKKTGTKKQPFIFDFFKKIDLPDMQLVDRKSGELTAFL